MTYFSILFVLHVSVGQSQNIVNSTTFGFEESTEEDDRDESSQNLDAPPLNNTSLKYDHDRSLNGFSPVDSKAAGVTIGKVLSWQDYSLFLSYQYSEKLSFWVSNGFGRSEFRDKYQDLEYNLEIKSIALKSGVRYFFLPVFPVYIQSSLGLSRLTGEISPNRTVQENSPPSESLFTSRYSALAASIDFNMGLQYVFENKWYIDFTLMNMNASLPFSSKVDTDNQQLEGAIEDKLDDIFQYGIFNIGFGYTW